MAYSEEALTRANEELEKRRQTYAMRTMELQEKVRSSVPGLSDAEREYRAMGLLRMRARLSGDVREAERLSEGLAEQRKKIDSMLARLTMNKGIFIGAVLCIIGLIGSLLSSISKNRTVNMQNFNYKCEL